LYAGVAGIGGDGGCKGEVEGVREDGEGNVIQEL